MYAQRHACRFGGLLTHSYGVEPDARTVLWRNGPERRRHAKNHDAAGLPPVLDRSEQGKKWQFQLTQRSSDWDWQPNRFSVQNFRLHAIEVDTLRRVGQD